MHIVVSGGTGYIGSHVVAQLLEEKEVARVTILDNLCNSKEEVVKNIRRSVPEKNKPLIFHKVDLAFDKKKLSSLFEVFLQQVDAVIHFAGLKAVGESVQNPLLYYQNNLQSTMNLVEVMEEHGCHTLLFSSSATVYGDSTDVPFKETHELKAKATNPYGQTKLVIEHILQDMCVKKKAKWKIAVLRYFNPIGAHPKQLLFENPKGIPGNLVPFLKQVVEGKRPYLSIFGHDWPTPDGTGVRDYIHIMDLADGHLAALKFLMAAKKEEEEKEEKEEKDQNPLFSIFNLGTGKGKSVKEVVDCVSLTIGKPVPIRYVERRPGDVAISYANVQKAHDVLGWKATRTFEEAIQSVFL